MKEIPVELTIGPFTTAQARRLGVSRKMLMRKRFVRLFPRVYRHVDHVMTEADWVTAARLALPGDACLTGISRIQAAGLDYGPRRPIRFVVARDHHIAIGGIFLHRTKKMPPTDDLGVTLAAAYIGYCSLARVVDAIKVGDWLLRNTAMTKADVRDIALAALWRDGAHEAIWLLDHLDGDAWSLPESETRSILTFAGLPRPEVNRHLDVGDDLMLIGDLIYRRYRLVVEYEGAHHQEDRAQYVADVDRYAILRRHDLRYVQVTKEKLRRPRTLVGEVYRELLSGGYEGPPPTFGDHWRQLFLPVSTAVGPRRERAGSGRAVS